MDRYSLGRWLGKVICCLMIPILPAEPGAGPAAADLVINEILIDPDGSDAGQEFVELLNTGPGPVDLEGVVFQFANGADGPEWKTRWSGEAECFLAPGTRFLIVDRNWMGPAAAQAEVYLGLQNGPDAVRLARGETILDLVGYGPLTDSLMMEGNPVPVVTGQSLSRRPDGKDTDDNQADFVPADPTPGVQNFQPWSLDLLYLLLDPPSLEQPGQNLVLEICLENDGTNPIPPAPIELHVGKEIRQGRLDECRPGEQKTLVWQLAPQQWGSLPLSALVLPPAVPDTLELDLGRLQVGPGKLYLNEVLAAPDQGQQEWVELRAGDEDVQLGDFSLRDEDGSWRTLPELTLGPEELVVVAQDSLALARWLVDNVAHGAAVDCGVGQAAGRIRGLGSGWPALNNSSAADRDFADRVYLADRELVVVDHLTWGGQGWDSLAAPEPGRSLERIAVRPGSSAAANWAGSTAPAGSTPGCSNSLYLADSGYSRLTVEPRILDPDRGVSAVHVRFQVTDPAVGAEVRIYDLWGGLVRDLGGDRFGPGPRDLLWDGRDDSGQFVSAGGYVVLLQTRADGGLLLDRCRVLLAVRKRAGR